MRARAVVRAAPRRALAVPASSSRPMNAVLLALVLVVQLLQLMRSFFAECVQVGHRMVI